MTITISSSFFFFSSRRRHTRWPRDWSSDVWSSDLVRGIYANGAGKARHRPGSAPPQRSASSRTTAPSSARTGCVAPHRAARWPQQPAPTTPSSRDQPGKAVERFLPALAVRLARLLVGQPAVRHHHRGRSVRMPAEIDLDELNARADVRAVPRPREHQPRRRRDLAVLAATAERLTVRAAHDQPQPAADTQIDLGDRRVPVRPRRIPAAQHLRARPRPEHRLDRGSEPAHDTDRRRILAVGGGHGCSRSLRMSSTASNIRVQTTRCRSNQSAASTSVATFRSSWWVRPSTVRATTPARSSTLRCFEIVGFDTPRPRDTTPTVAEPCARRSTISRRIGWATALNGSLALWVTIAGCRIATALVRPDAWHLGRDRKA